MATTYQIQASEINAQLVFNFIDAISNAPISLTQASVTLNGTPPVVKGTPVRQSFPCVVAADGKTATYITTGTDFAIVGKWSIQAVYTGPYGTHHSPLMTLQVIPNL